jgi:hypothetical protein
MNLSANDASSQKIYNPLTQRADTTAPKADTTAPKMYRETPFRHFRQSEN